VNATSKYTLMTTVAGLGLVPPAAVGLGLFPSQYDQTVLTPYPALTFFPYLWLSSNHNWGNAAVMLPMLLFFLWSYQLFRGAGKVPRRSYVFLALLTVLSVIDFVVNWKLGMRYQGAKFMAVVCSVNIVWLACLGLGFARARNRTTSWGTSLFLHWMLFAWLAWYAFPWLDEIPSHW
jgi:hypothetical protein